MCVNTVRLKKTWLAIFVSLSFIIAFLYMWTKQHHFQDNSGSGGFMTAVNTDRHFVNTKKEPEKEAVLAPRSNAQRKPMTIQLATVACGSRVEQGMVMLKSAALLTATTSNSHLVFHVFSEPTNHQRFSRMVESWPPKIRERVVLRLYNGEMPRFEGWLNPFYRNCSNLRLFFHILLPDVDKVLYLDSDILVLYTLDHLWSFFPKMNSSHMMAFSNDTEDPKRGFYYYNSTIPFILPAGKNSGVMLMNLTRLRHSNWTRMIVHYSHEYKGKLILGDQDVMNVYFRFHPDEYYLLDCSTNYRKDHCRYPNCNICRCRPAEADGAYILHGNDFGFKVTKAFGAVHRAFTEFKLEDDLSVLLDMVRHNLKGVADLCGQAAPLFMQRLDGAVEQWRNRAGNTSLTRPPMN